MLNNTMDILTKNIELKVSLPVKISEIEDALTNMSVLRYSIVKIEGNIATINVSYENL